MTTMDGFRLLEIENLLEASAKVEVGVWGPTGPQRGDSHRHFHLHHLI